MAEMWVVSVKQCVEPLLLPPPTLQAVTLCHVISHLETQHKQQTTSTTPSVTSATKNMVLLLIYYGELTFGRVWLKYTYVFFDLQANFVKMIIIRAILQISHQTSHYWQELTDFNGKTVLLWEFEKLSRADSCNFSEMFLSNLIYFKQAYYYPLFT